MAAEWVPYSPVECPRCGGPVSCRACGAAVEYGRPGSYLCAAPRCGSFAGRWQYPMWHGPALIMWCRPCGVVVAVDDLAAVVE